MRLRLCERCGEALSESHGVLSCKYCGATYDKEDEALALENLIEEKKQEALANRKRVLWDETHKKYPSERAIVKAAESVREMNPDDPLALFYIAVHKKDKGDLHHFLSETETVESIAKDVVRFMMESVDPEDVLPLKTFIEKHFDGDDYTKMMTDLENEAEELEDGTYMTSIPRDVFVAYSSKDMDKVNEMVAYLEENDQSCFCALRNLRHGKGSVENYEHAIEDAMKHCRVFLFLSSENSRSLRCETLKHEIPYLLDNLPNVHRIHFRLDDGITKPGAQVLLREFDNGQEWCRTKEDLIERLIAAKRKKAAPKKEAIPVPEPEEEIDEAPSKVVVIDKKDPTVLFTGDTLLSYTGTAKRIRIEGFTQVERSAFKDAPYLEEIDTGSLKTLKPFAIDGAMKLKRFHIGRALEEIGSGCFARCPELEEFTSDSDDFEIDRGGLVQDIIFFRYPPKAKGSSYRISHGIDEIDVGAFSGCENLKSVSIPSSVITIGNGAFSKCPLLDDVFIPDSVVMMGKNVFAQCPSLTIRVQPDFLPGSWNPSFAGGALVSYGAKK